MFLGQDHLYQRRLARIACLEEQRQVGGDWVCREKVASGG
jgi:hypothetical protein